MTAPARELADHVALVMGAGRGIGAAIARELAAAGAAVVAAGRNVDALERLCAELRADGATALAVQADVTDETAVAQAVNTAVATFGRLTVAVNNAAAHGSRPVPLAQLPVDQFDHTIAVTLRGVFLGLKYELPAIAAAGGGSVVTIASTAGTQAVAGLADYVAAKHAVIGLSATAALDYAADGVRVNTVLPGPILTGALRSAGPAAQEHVAATLPLRRIGRAEEVAAAVRWLCGPASSFVTGAPLVVDGGRLAGTPSFGPPPITQERRT
ncbi:SDR family NAD(P)-dependent oxidoreductase [Actinoplanes sp. NPDC051633]|uniref:SDR family NAD(P)-dependent oxidoreductase n=1 Tax=Actinoplanes sp. NPDC051633 TaxID=3155670 RepID=UPI0034349D81